MAWFDMNDIIWHEWHDLTQFDPNYTNYMNSMIWHEFHDLTWIPWSDMKTWLTWFDSHSTKWQKLNDSKMTAEGTVGAPTCFSCFSRKRAPRYNYRWHLAPFDLLRLKLRCCCCKTPFRTKCRSDWDSNPGTLNQNSELLHLVTHRFEQLCEEDHDCDADDDTSDRLLVIKS
jgi:hypothetical protein